MLQIYYFYLKVGRNEGPIFNPSCPTSRYYLCLAVWYGEGAVPPIDYLCRQVVGGTAPSLYQSKVIAPSLYQVIFFIVT